MQEFSGPPATPLPRYGNLSDDVVRNGSERPDRVAFSVRAGGGWHEVTAAAFLAEVRAVAAGLVAAGVEAGDRVALMSRTRYEWTLMDYAIWFAGAVGVPVYETATTEQLAWVLADSGARAAVVESPTHRSRVEEVRNRLPALSHVWCLEEDAVHHLSESGTQVGEEALEERRTTAGPDSVATVIYTSGTTGRPKGCVLTHGNFMAELDLALDVLDDLFADDESATLLVLPLAHVLARIVSVGAVRSGVRLAHVPDVRTLVDDLATFRPTFVLAVPRVFEKVFTKASQEAAAAGRGRLFDRAAKAAIAYSRSLDGGRPRPVLRLRHAAYERLVYAQLRQLWGGRCSFAVSGGAPLGERLGHFYRGLGLPVLEGYGLTETTAAVTVNQPDAVKLGTVGRPLPGTSVRVAVDGELLVRGPQVMRGYWRDDDATTQVLGAGGWLRTGDLGEIDHEGFVRVTGRKQEILVTTGGKSIAPTLLEDVIRAHPLVGQCMVVGDGRPFVAALVTLDAEALAPWARARGKTGHASALARDPDVRAEVQYAVDEANRSVSQAEAVRRFVLLPREWTEEEGLLTPSLRLKRADVVRRFRREVEELYAR